MKKQLFTGACTALYLPLTPAGAPDMDGLDRLLRHQLENGADAILVGDGLVTGGAAGLGPEALLEVLEHCVMAVNRQVPVLAAVREETLEAAVGFARAAGIRGADGLFLAVPETCGDTPAAFCTAVADAIGLPVILHRQGDGKACPYTLEDYKALAAHPLVLAEAANGTDFGLIAHVAAACGDDLAFYTCCEQQLLPLLALGGAGIISVAANCAPQDMHDICSLFFMGRVQESRALALQNLPLTDALAAGGRQALTHELQKLDILY